MAYLSQMKNEVCEMYRGISTVSYYNIMPREYISQRRGLNFARLE